MSQRIPVKPADIQQGDMIDQTDADLNIVPVRVTEVEKFRAGGATRYRVHVESGEPFVLQPGNAVMVERPAPYTDPTPFGMGGDHCPWCGADWKRPHDEDCGRPDTETANAMWDEWQRHN